MRRVVVGLVGVAVGMVIAGVAGSVSRAQPAAKPGGHAAPRHGAPAVRRAAKALPASLDALYPPRAKAPVLHLEMLGLSRALDGILVDLEERDQAGVASNLAQLKAAYARIGTLVPEWRTSLPTGPVAALAQALASGDPARVMPAVGALGQVCESCHHQFMPAVQLRYHWSSFDHLEVADPISKQKLPFGRFKHQLSANLTGVALDAEQQQPANARRHARELRARFQALGQVCQSCHEEARHYYVDKKMQATVRRLEQAVAGKKPDLQAVREASLVIGRDACSKCHRVHVPGAFAPRPAPPR